MMCENELPYVLDAGPCEASNNHDHACLLYRGLRHGLQHLMTAVSLASYGKEQGRCSLVLQM